MSIVLAGFALGLSLIVAIGPQNALLIKQGIKRQGVTAVVIVCMVSDVLLIFGGTAGVGYLVDRFPMALTILKYAGALYLAYFTFLCFRDAFKKDAEAIKTEHHDLQEVASFDGSTRGTLATRTRITPRTQQRAWLKPALAALAFTWLNPAAYIDVLVMLGGVANQYGTDGRWLFATGALCASVLWFPTVGFGASKFSDVLAQPRVWRIINFAIGCIMVALTYKLLFLV